MVEQGTHNPLVVGSNPTGPTRKDFMRRAPDRTRPPRVKSPRSAGHGLREPVLIVVLLLAALVFSAVGFALGRTVFSALGGGMTLERPPRVRVASARSATDTAAEMASSGAEMVELPKLVGMRADEAWIVAETAEFAVRFVEVGAAVSSVESRTVIAQSPAAGAIVSADSTISLTVPPLSADASAGVAGGKVARRAKWVVCIDPGHQSHTDTKLEPIGPGSKIEKARATGGTTGVSSGVPEFEIALQISTNLKKRLEAAGVKVVMTRTTNDVRIANSKRAKIANKADADVFVRIHGGVSMKAADSGIRTLYPVKNRWTRPVVSESRIAAKAIQGAVCRATLATDRGAKTEAGFVGFNWSKVPSVLVEVGHMSNPVEDRLLASPTYQDKVAQGVCDGIVAYLRSKAK